MVPHLQTGFHVSRPTSLTPSSTANISPTGLSPSIVGLFQTVWLCQQLNRGLGSSHFALATTLGISVDVFFLQLLRCFNSLRSLYPAYVFSRSTLCGWVSPFRNSRSKLYCQLPRLIAGLPRLSSPVAAKASAMCAWSLDPITLKHHHLSQLFSALTQTTAPRHRCV